MILGRYLLTALRLDLKFSKNIIIGVEGPYEGCYKSMVDVRNYNFDIITAKTVIPEDFSINLYVDEFLESESAISATRRILSILYAKYEKADINKVMNKQFQHIHTK